MYSRLAAFLFLLCHQLPQKQPGVLRGLCRLVASSKGITTTCSWIRNTTLGIGSLGLRDPKSIFIISVVDIRLYLFILITQGGKFTLKDALIMFDLKLSLYLESPLNV